MAEIRGITPARAKSIADEYASQFGLREVMMTFAGYGLTPNEALPVLEKVGGGDRLQDPGKTRTASVPPGCTSALSGPTPSASGCRCRPATPTGWRRGSSTSCGTT